MKIGAAYPGRELKGDLDALAQFCRAIEDLGFDYLVASDHVLGAAPDRQPKLSGPATHEDPFHDPLVIFAYAAAITSRIELATGVLVLPQRQTALVARQAADVDLLSQGRLRLGVGVGWNYVEYEALGQDFKRRGQRLTEQVCLLRQLWSSSLLSFDGEFDRIDRACINPRPKRQIPIWFGGFSRPAFERAALLGDGFIFYGEPCIATQEWLQIQPLLNSAERDCEAFGRELHISRASNAGMSADHLMAWRDLGGTHACVSSLNKGLSCVQAHIDFLADVMKLVDPQR
jgi:probable F420-dependent oxidoreductase